MAQAKAKTGTAQSKASPKTRTNQSPRRMSKPPKTVDEYLAAQPDEVRAALEKLRKDIKTAAPDATEVISYGVPTFRTNKAIVSFGAAKNHCALYVMNLGVIKELAADLKKYDTSGGTVRFPANKPLPSALVKKIVQARMKLNEARKPHKT